MSSAAPSLPQSRPLLALLLARLSGWAGIGGGEGPVLRAHWPAPLLAALVVLASALPGLLAVPALDRDESRFAQATAQMLETGDLVSIRYQDQPRDKKPAGIHWLQAASVRLLSSAEARDIRPYRLPSLLGAMIAAAACAWGAAAALGPRAGALAGAMLGAGLLLSTEASIAKTDAVLCGATTLALAALGRLYLRANGSAAVGRGGLERAAFWIALAVGVGVKGPVAPSVALLTVAALAVADRRLDWILRLGWSWGPLAVLLICGPWAFAVTVATDGAFWSRAVAGDIAPKLLGGHEGHGAWPGVHAALAPLLAFPFGFLLPAAAIAGWTRRSEPAVRFALAWLLPNWLALELSPTKLPHYPLPLYGAVAWLMAAACTGWRIGPRARIAGAALGGLGALALCAAAAVAAVRFGAPGAGAAAALTGALALLSAGVGGALLLRGEPVRAVLAAGAAGLGAHLALTGLLAPRLDGLWVSSRAAALLSRSGLDPRDGRTLGPVAVAGFAEPSLVFALGTDTELDDGGALTAEALAQGVPALVEDRQDTAFRTRLSTLKVAATRVGEVRGFDYSVGRPVRLTLWRPLRLPPPPVDPAAPAEGGS